MSSVPLMSVALVRQPDGAVEEPMHEFPATGLSAPVEALRVNSATSPFPSPPPATPYTFEPIVAIPIRFSMLPPEWTWHPFGLAASLMQLLPGIGVRAPVVVL